MRRVAMTTSLLLLSATLASAADGGKALLIGIEGYEKVPALKYVANDVRRLAESLSDRCGFEVKQVIDTNVDKNVGQIRPTTHRDALMKAVASWVDGMRETDTALLYFSGHGFLDRDGKLYLASINCDARDPVPGGVPVAWLRQQLSKCPARCKVLLLDACHAGATKGVGDGRATAKEIEKEINALPDVVTLASCSADQESILWDGKRHSLFTYWLAEAAKGHADTDADNQVTMDELTKYVQRNVVQTAGTLDHQQSPMLLGGGEARAKLQLAPKAVSLKRLVTDMAEKVDTTMRQKKLSAVGVPEFASGESGGTLGSTYGTLPAYIANELRDQLAVLAGSDYEVIAGPALNEELTRRGVDAGSLETAGPSDLKVGGINVVMLAIGRVRGREGATFRLGCQLKRPGSPGQLGSANGACFLNDSEWAMLGHSAAAPDRPLRPGNPQSAGAISEQIGQLDTAAQNPHPAVDPRFPLAIVIEVRDSDGTFRKREGQVKGNDYFVTLRRGEVYRINVEYRRTHGAFLRLLVDGLNTHEERASSQQKGVVVEPVEGEGEWTAAARVNLAEARAWYLDPATENSDGTVQPARYCIRGFYKETGGEDAYNEFVVTDAPDSTAARKGYTEQIGLITAAVYSPTKPRAIGTKLGKEYKQQVEQYTGGLVPGDLMGVIHIRYEEP